MGGRGRLGEAIDIVDVGPQPVLELDDRARRNRGSAGVGLLQGGEVLSATPGAFMRAMKTVIDPTVKVGRVSRMTSTIISGSKR